MVVQMYVKRYGIIYLQLAEQQDWVSVIKFNDVF
jgi:hypothetical protein